MKPEFDREIEALLRGHKGRARGDFARAPALDSSHMDADELSAYAENALPPATRARYTAHLADCDDCRRTVTGVALASGAAPVLEKRAGLASAADAVAASPSEKPAGAGLSRWLAALFSPRALRWAVPLLAIALTGVVAYVALRSRNEGEFVAGLSEREAQRQDATTSGGVQQSPSNATNSTASADAVATSANSNMNANAGAAAPATATNAPPQPAGERKQDAASGPAQEIAKEEQAGAGATTFDGLTASRESAPPPGEDRSLADVSKSAPVVTGAVAPAAAPAPKVSESERADTSTSDDELRRAEDARRAKEKDSDAFGRNASRRAANDEAPSGARNETAQKRSPQPPPPASARAQRDSDQNRDSGGFSSRNRGARGAANEREDAPSERRSVAGYQFRREDGAWVDVRYNGSMRLRDVGRGTESYRTLAADFPEVQSIAARLPGTVVVVLGGRAYRIN